LHLALVMAINSRLLVLDEPTLGLDILYRKQFYTTLLEDYFDADKTILITTHQVEEIENLLTEVIFIRDGRIDLACGMDQLEKSFTELQVDNDRLEAAATLQPIHSRAILGGKSLIYENVAREELEKFGTVKTPSIADLFVAKMDQGRTLS
jgi:ABC-2 type transport system ATP-binding protein